MLVTIKNVASIVNSLSYKVADLKYKKLMDENTCSKVLDILGDCSLLAYGEAKECINNDTRQLIDTLKGTVNTVYDNLLDARLGKIPSESMLR